jgi:hypothetical protein
VRLAAGERTGRAAARELRSSADTALDGGSRVAGRRGSAARRGRSNWSAAKDSKDAMGWRSSASRRQRRSSGGLSIWRGGRRYERDVGPAGERAAPSRRTSSAHRAGRGCARFWSGTP